MSSENNFITTSTKKWTYVPRKFTNLPRIDIDQIRKQLIQAAKEESNESDHEESQSNVGSPITECNKLTQKQLHEEYISGITENKENVGTQPFDICLTKNGETKQNDSFDLDFSALKICTPEKHKDLPFSIVTPKINIIVPLESASAKKPCDTPKTIGATINNHFIISNKKSVFKTPQNKPPIGAYSGSKQITPYQRLKKSTPLFCRTISECEERGNQMTVQNIEYFVMNLLGRGASSEVYHCYDPVNEVHVAIKCVLLLNPDTAAGYINEAKLLESLQNCERIIKMYDYEIIDNEKLLMVLEIGDEDLHSILKNFSTRQCHLPAHLILFYWMEMLYAVQQIHKHGVIHSDLKPANFLKTEYGLKLIDFGIASRVQGDMTCVYKSCQEGSSNYISPEALLQARNADSPFSEKCKYKVHFKSDVWSLGCILYQLVYRSTPFQQINPLWAKLSAITNPNHRIEYPDAEWVSPHIVNTIRRCLQYNIGARPSVNELIDEYESLLKRI